MHEPLASVVLGQVISIRGSVARVGIAISGAEFGCANPRDGWFLRQHFGLFRQ